VFILPVWWGGMPAKFKGLIDELFYPVLHLSLKKINQFQRSDLKVERQMLTPK
jgi:putative NADPH-quinone reductase